MAGDPVGQKDADHDDDDDGDPDPPVGRGVVLEECPDLVEHPVEGPVPFDDAAEEPLDALGEVCLQHQAPP